MSFNIQDTNDDYRLMINSISSTTTLNNGVQMPWFGLGVYRVPDGEVVENSVHWALEAGYRSIDMAAVYGNESGVGRAIKQSGIPREQIFVTTKVWNTDQGYDKTRAAFDASLRNLNLEYVDLYLIHWPVKDKFRETSGVPLKRYMNLARRAPLG